ncbi:TonB-dependent receptor [Maribacter sp. TH_r10]|uniref:TonB-dependent receptor n=1 Tax=Maribacter sp. TH_r10 TaxID=3082086 RepID=UPI002953EF30|nr:carboxypeptidase-like regulatory domain-containing protein [Maribacter sp. TH_r10]MDV7137439.1 TonB-dependent receptor [Maribacter sp. TH_r10]
MRKIIFSLLLLTSVFLSAQETGSIAGTLTDTEMNNEPLPFANVVIKGTTKGTTSDFDGLYEIANLEPGTYTVVFSFLGYETVEMPNVQVEAGKVSTINVPMATTGVALEGVTVTTVARKDSETALLIDQKKAIEIKESIGAVELGKIGVSDVATATTKISGVSSSEASGDVFVRGLGDRYLSTTLNGLTVPSDDVEKKNIDLSLFPTRVIRNVSISKTYAAQNTADQSSGAINISGRELVGTSELGASYSAGINTNVAKSGVYDDFKISPNQSDVTFGFYNSNRTVQEQITQQGWNTRNQENPIDYSFSIIAGKRIKDKLAIFFTASHSKSYEYQKGLFRQYRSNFIDDTITDATTYRNKIVNTALLDMTFFANDKNRIKSSTFFVNKIDESVFEGGRNGEATIFEETNPSEGLFQFIRDQNTKQTRLLVTQLLGTHEIGEKHTIKWAGGYNLLNADEPNRIRNEVNWDPNEVEPDFDVQLGRTGGFQQRKSSQLIEDTEFNGYLKDVIDIIKEEDNDKSFKIELGVSYRNKERDFSSEFVGVEETSTNAINPTSIDKIGNIFQQSYFDAGILEYNYLGLNANDERKDLYTGKLESMAGFVDFNLNLDKWNFDAGLRYQKDEIFVNWDIGNLFPREGESTQDYNNLYPSLNIKYSLNELHALRLAVSRTLTLPEFKEISPFEYVSPTGQITRGNSDVTASRNLNYDLKWEYFPSTTQLVSVAAFYKDISDPINKVRDRGSAGVFSYFNSAEKAEVFGLEAETKIDLIKPTINEEDGTQNGHKLNIVLNATRMWHSQDLKEIYNENGELTRTFRYKGIEKTDLQGASDWIFNTSLNFNTVGENQFSASLNANYASDKIYALGVPTDQTNRDIFYDDAIIEKGFVVLNAVVSKIIAKKWKVTLVGKNLLNPEIKQTQSILTNVSEVAADSSAERIEEDKTVSSYTTGAGLSLGLSYRF